MANFLLLYTGGKVPEKAADRERMLHDWTAWYNKLGTAVVDRGDPFTPKAKAIFGQNKTQEGPVDCMASGYSIIRANSLEAAVTLVRDCPVLKDGAKVDIYETSHMAE